GGGDDESGFARATIFLAVQRDGNAAKRAIVHVHRARPGDAFGIEIQIVAVKKMGVDQGSQKIVRRGNCMKITVKVEIDFCARLDLRSTAAGSSTFHSEDGPERRLARG